MNGLRLILTLGALSLMAACGGGGNSTVTTSPADNIGKTTFKLTLALAGTGVKSVDATIALPAGATAAADATGATLSGVLVQLIGGTNTLLTGNAGIPGVLKLNLLNADTYFVIKSGDIVTVTLNLDAGAAVPNATDFTLSSYNLFDIHGAEISGALSLH